MSFSELISDLAAFEEGPWLLATTIVFHLLIPLKQKVYESKLNFAKIEQKVELSVWYLIKFQSNL